MVTALVIGSGAVWPVRGCSVSEPQMDFTTVKTRSNLESIEFMSIILPLLL